MCEVCDTEGRVHRACAFLVETAKRVVVPFTKIEKNGVEDIGLFLKRYVIWCLGKLKMMGSLVDM